MKANDERILAIKIDPRGKWLASATEANVILWRLDGAHVVSETLYDGAIAVTDMAADPSGNFLAWTTKKGDVTIWEVARSLPKVFTDQHSKWSLAVAFSADGTQFATAGDDGLLVVRNVADGSITTKFQTNRANLWSISFDGLGEHIATASVDGPVDIWSIYVDRPDASGVSLSLVPDKRWKVKYSPDGRWLAVGSWRGTIALWDGRSLAYRGTIDANDQRINDIVFPKTSSTLFTVNESGVIRQWELNEIRSMFNAAQADRRDVIAGVYSPDGSKFAAGGANNKAQIYHVAQNGLFQPLCSMKHNDWVFGATFSPDSKQLATIEILNNEVHDHDVVKLWNADNCDEVDVLKGFERNYVQGIAFNPVGWQMAWGDRSGQLSLVDLGTNLRRVKLPKIHSDVINELSFDREGKLLVSGSADGKVIAWDLQQSRFRRLLGPQQSVNTVKISPDGRFAAAGGDDERIFIWDLRQPNGEPVKTLRMGGGTNRLAFSADGEILAAGSNSRYVSMWSVRSWEQMFQLNVLVGVRSVYGFHPSRRDLAFDGEDGLIRILPTKSTTQPKGVRGIISGTDVVFDELPIKMNLPPADTCISTAGNGCSLGLRVMAR
jgi:WD40 repeat protein